MLRRGISPEVTDAELILASRADTGMEPPRGDRLAEGCAIVVGAGAVYPAAGEVAVEVEIWQGRRP